ncbi:MAG: glycine oxidase ThiO [Ktedonobacteraceae bacterium]|nr:glycine oxidase ThiO [Ktedonobacteraceae bacterium]
MQRSADVIIIGAGIIGSSIAYFLGKRGVNVLVLDKNEIGSQSSSAAAGLLAPIRPLAKEDNYRRLLLDGIKRLPAIVPELEEATNIDVEYRLTGTLRVLPRDKKKSVSDWVTSYKQAGFHVEMLSPDEAHEREPLLFSELCAAVAIAEEGQVNPINLTQAYAGAAKALGATFYEHCEVVGIQQASDQEKVTGIRTVEGEVFSCNHLVIATGAWSACCGQWLHWTLPVYPVRGQIVALKQPASPIKHIIFDEGLYDEDIYIAPKPNNGLIIGATKADVGFNTSVTAGEILHLLDVGTRLVPALEQCEITRTWAGLRPKTPNSRPILGAVPGWENVFVASGHGGFGIMLSAITGETLAEQIATGHIPDIIRPFQPEAS